MTYQPSIIISTSFASSSREMSQSFLTRVSGRRTSITFVSVGGISHSASKYWRSVARVGGEGSGNSLQYVSLCRFIRRQGSPKNKGEKRKSHTARSLGNVR
jgi:hypothetical protein